MSPVRGKKRRYENKSGVLTAEKNQRRTRGPVLQGNKKEAKQCKKMVSF